eukprot:204147_1
METNRRSWSFHPVPTDYLRQNEKQLQSKGWKSMAQRQKIAAKESMIPASPSATSSQSQPIIHGSTAGTNYNSQSHCLSPLTTVRLIVKCMMSPWLPVAT